MHLNTYLHFGDNCREAFEFYRSIFGGEFMFLSTFADGPEDMPPVPDGEKGRIMHVSLQIGDSVLMGSDSTSAFGRPPDVGKQLLDQRVHGKQGGDGPAVRRPVGGRQRRHGPAGYVLGRLLRHVHRQVRNQLDAELRNVGGLKRRETGNFDGLAVCLSPPPT